MDNAIPEFWVYTKEHTILENEVVDDEWYICNVQQTGRIHTAELQHYRTPTPIYTSDRCSSK